MFYDHKSIETKWQKIWEEQKVFSARDNSEQEKFYVLVEFPYPSGDGLHVGHCRSYTALDIVARKKRMEGRNVLFPIGFDAFGLPTENYAIKHKIHPRVATDKNIANFTRQLKSVGFSFDWGRVVDTTDEQYYKWTQWLFLQFLKAGLAYQAEIPINWCPACRIGLANEEVVDGKCERCGAVTEKKLKKQWMLAITKYAERLLNDLETVDYLPRIKAQQQNWIGKSEGAEIEFAISGKKLGDLIYQNYPQIASDVSRDGGLYLVTWNTVTPEDSKSSVLNTRKQAPSLSNGGIHSASEVEVTNPNNPESKNFVSGIELIDSQAKALTILKSLRKSEEDSKNKFGVLEAVVTKNHVHAVIWLGENMLIENAIKKLKGPSSCEFWKQYSSRPIGGMNSPVNEGTCVNRDTHNFKKSEETYNPKKNCNQLWRTGYHFSHLSNLKSFQNAIGYLRGHKEKSSVAELYTDLSISVKVFTTRADTLFGVTYVTLAPENALVDELKPQIQNWNEVENYRETTKKKSDLERTELAKEKTGVELKGVRAVNPANGEEVPIFIADYVLASYGTGAVMAVPAHDERDFEFAETNKLPVKYVIGIFFNLLTKGLRDGYMAGLSKFGIYESVIIDPSKTVTNIYVLPNKIKEFLAWARHYLTNMQYLTCGDYEIEEIKNGLSGAFIDDGVLVDSGEFSKLASADARTKITAWLEEKGYGKKTVNYKLRDWVFSRQRYWGEPIPIVHCERCGVVPLPESELPLTLPHVENYEPTETGESPLSKITAWANTTCPKCGGSAKRETDTMPNWAGSSWYFLRYIDPRNDTVFADRAKLDYWTPVDLYNGGMEHTVLHLLYSRFWHKFLFDQNLVPTSEPYQRRVSHGMILGPDNEKMSKSRGNVINPDSIIAEHGADTLRIYEMFIGPFDQAAPWSTNGVLGVRRFLDKVWRLFEGQGTRDKGQGTNELARALHQSIKKIGEDIEDFRFNTAVSQLMILVNAASEVAELPREFQETFLKLLAPFAPHLAEELWTKLGNTTSLSREAWPTYDPALLVSDTLTLAIQVNGKLRDTLEVSATATKEEILMLAKKSAPIQKWLAGKTLVKEIFVPGKLVSFVVKE